MASTQFRPVIDPGYGNWDPQAIADELGLEFGRPSIQSVIRGTASDDVLAGTTDADSIIAGGGNDDVTGGDGNDFIRAGSGDDLVQGGLGDDHITGDAGNDLLLGNAGNDSLIGGRGNDVLDGGDGDDTVFGGEGNDTAVASLGNDWLIGGNGFDTIDLGGLAVGATIDLASRSLHVSQGGTDYSSTVTGFEAVLGSDFADIIRGDRARNEIDGGSGDDTIQGGRGADKLTGGDGADMFVYQAGDANSRAVDHITDFTVDEDSLDLTGLLGNVTSYDNVVRVEAKDGNTTVQAFVHNHWVDVVVLESTQITSLAELGLPLL